MDSRVRESFNRQQFMATIGAEMTRVDNGAVEIVLRVRPDLTQQHGFVHAAAVAAIADSACGYAAFSLMPAGSGVLTVEYKINLMAPAAGEMLIARGQVIRSGRTLSVCRADVVALASGQERAVAFLVATVMAIQDRPDVVG